MHSLITRPIFLLFFSCFTQTLMAQGCSDAGVCTIGDYYARLLEANKKSVSKQEIELAYTYGTHLKYERFYQPQVNYRYIKKNGSFFEIRLPLNISRNTLLNVTNSGIGDIMGTYNGKFHLCKHRLVKYSAGLRISFSNADKKDNNNDYSYPMSLQTGLGTTDLLAAASYDFGRYISIGTGVQVPLFQYNKNVIVIDHSSTPATLASDYHRKPDALIKLTGHYKWRKLKINGGALAILHLGNDYYDHGSRKYILSSSRGATLNWNIETNYALTKKWMIGVLYAEPFKTRTSIPDGLARSRIVSPKITFAFK